VGDLNQIGLLEPSVAAVFLALARARAASARIRTPVDVERREPPNHAWTRTQSGTGRIAGRPVQGCVL